MTIKYPCAIELFSTHKTGSMLTYKILVALFCDGDENNNERVKVQKRHKPFKIDLPFRDRPKYTVVTVRDFRDCVVSYWRALKNRKRMRPFRRDEIIHAYEKIAHEINFYLEYWQKIESGEALLLRYEEFVDNYDYIYDNLEGYFGIKISSSLRSDLSNHFSFNRHKKICDNLERWENESTEEHLRGRHVQSGRAGTWREFITEEHIELLNRLVGEPLKVFGYEK